MTSLALDGILLLCLGCVSSPEFADELLVLPHLLDEVQNGDAADPVHPSHCILVVMFHQDSMYDIDLFSSRELG